MIHTDELFADIERGLENLNVGISTGLNTLDEVIAGIQKRTIYNIAAGQGVGNNCLYLYDESKIYKCYARIYN